MSDKEPRRRKKRKDLQAARKEDLHSDDHLFTSIKTDAKDSDQENDDDIPLSSNQPSLCAKFVFVLLFSALVVSMSFVFISLQGTNRRELEILDEDHHAEEPDVLHDIHEADHEEESHPEAEHGEGDHEEHDDTVKWSLSKAFSQENIEALLPGISNILSFNDKASTETEDTDEQEPPTTEEKDSLTEGENESIEEEVPDVVNMKSDYIEEDSADIDENEELGDDDEEEEDQIAPEISITELPQEIFTSQDAFKTETTSPPPQDHRAKIVTSSPVESDYSTSIPDEVEDFSSNLEELSNEPPPQDESDFIENDEPEELPLYERGDITNEADYEIRQQLDELEKALENGIDDHNNIDDDDDINDQVDDDDDDINDQVDDDDDDINDQVDEEDDDDYEGDDGIIDEFDFWQF